MVRFVKREPGSSSVRAGAENGEAGTSDSGFQGTTDRRVLRSRYHAVKTLISDKRDDILRVESNNFSSIINEVESLHQLVQKPREQIADAEALLDITSSLVTSVKAHGDEGVTPSDFVNCLLRDFVQQGTVSNGTDDTQNSIVWKDIGFAVSHVFRRGPGCCTMLGPMDTELKQQKAAVHRKHGRVRPTESARPEELEETGMEHRTDTDRNMSTMFDILKKNRRVRLENLVLNRNSFPQTVENLFALSFLAKDGRAEITVNKDGHQIVGPRNAPAASAVANGEVSYSHFVFRFDFKDWKLMKDSSREGEELMLHRGQVDVPSNSRTGSDSEESEAAEPTTPVRKLSRNRGLVIQEHTAAESSPETVDHAVISAAARKGKRKMR